jgi:hypothetical protein
MKIDAVTFHPPFEESEPFWAMRLEATGSEFLIRAAPIVARVGAVPVESIVLNLAGDGFVGLLRDTPRAGDELEVGYADTGLVGTGLTFDPPIA